MILRKAAVRHGGSVTNMARSLNCLHSSIGRASAPPISRSAGRLLSIEANSQNTADPTSSASAQPKILSAASSKKRKQKAVQEFIMSLGFDSAREHSGASWTKPHQMGSKGREVTPAQQFAEFQRIQKNTRSIGSRLDRRYVPAELISNPPGPEDVSLELLMASQAHMGHNTSLWNPANSRYIYGVRQGIHIISLETTAAHLRRAARVVEEVSYRGGVILFVGTRKGQMEIVTKAAELAGACHLFTKWTPGAITNRDVILKTQATKVVDHLDSELDGFDMYKGVARPLLPDLVVCLNPLENYTMLYECGLRNIPTIGVIDTNVDPSWVTYTIPANDDSLRAMAVVAGVLGRAGQKGKERRLQDSSRGKVSWNTSPELERHMKKEIQAAAVKRKQVMGRIQSNFQGFNEEEQKLLRIRNEEVGLEVSEDEMVEILGETAVRDAVDAVVKAAAASSATSGREEGKELADIEAQLERAHQRQDM
ncbi:37S ribosomal protein MRP4 [Metarhizium album ARSEF 1941]|uniref:37S ribosomal protein MRP4 n=1 Tax=Metarhizium album (strain ARSEF 1941) TaxID=1081103 RepID=A0A0B2X6V9_METAS|nr:37S ribosomal protein MRP4 [Metarhizium album ARSEF 1941]KHO01031.1 37S ribosomal protein MRP4 [Metarhizium album ARSEF 1941]